MKAISGFGYAVPFENPVNFGLDVVHGMRTIFPIPMAEAASFNLELIKKRQVWQQRRLLPMEFTATFAPMVDISRDARWGRSMEGAGKTLGMVASGKGSCRRFSGY